MTYTEIKIKIESLKKQVETVGGLNSEQLKKLSQKYRLECNYYSNSSEGNALSKEEIRSLITGVVAVDKKPLGDLMEIKSHDEVLKQMLGGGIVEYHLSEKTIKDLHTRLMYEEDVIKKQQLGHWRQRDSSMTTYKGEHYALVSAENVKGEMKELINRTNEAIDYILKGKNYAPHPIDVALNFHVDFLKISPFERGNQVVARMLSNQLLIAFVYTPFWIIKEDTQAYEQYLADVLCYEGAKDELFALIGKQILKSQQMVVDIQDGKSIEESEKFLNKIEMLKRQLKAKEEEQSKVKSSVWLSKAFTRSIFPLFNYVEKVIHESFGELFTSISSKYELTSTTEEGDQTLSLDLDNSTISWEGAEYMQSVICLSGFKLDEQMSALEIGIDCFFEESTYTVDLGGNNVYEKEYDKVFTEGELKLISDFICEQIVDKING